MYAQSDKRKIKKFMYKTIFIQNVPTTGSRLSTILAKKNCKHWSIERK